MLWHVVQVAHHDRTHGDDETDRWMDAERLSRCPNDANTDMVVLHLLGPGYPALNAREGSGDTHGSLDSACSAVWAVPE